VYGQLTERELLARLATGERTVTKYIYELYYATVTRWIQKNGGTEPDAADVYQEAMVILYEKAQIEDFRLSCKVGTYLFAVSKNLWYKKLQNQRRQPDSLDSLDFDGKANWAYEDDVRAHNEREAHYNQLNQALEQLGEPCRSLLKAFYQHDKSMQDIASEFGYTNSDNAKTQKYKCLTRLRKLFYEATAKV
jgi:RNA polymerase sigma factor (sigma-70 family)